MTNGDVIKGVFPNAEIKHGIYGIEGTPLVCLCLHTNTKMFEASFVEEWWNSQFREQTRWIPVSDPLKELPKDRTIWVTYEDYGYLGIHALFYDMTEWSEPYIAKNAIAYMDYIEPTPYKAESEKV